MTVAVSSQRGRCDARNNQRQRSGPPWLTENTLAGMARRKALMGYSVPAADHPGHSYFYRWAGLASLSQPLPVECVLTASLLGLNNYQRMFNDPRVRSGSGTRLSLSYCHQHADCGWLCWRWPCSSVCPPGCATFSHRLFSAHPDVGRSHRHRVGYMLHKEFGAVNYYLRLGIAPCPGLTRPTGAFTIVISYVWQTWALR